MLAVNSNFGPFDTEPDHCFLIQNQVSMDLTKEMATKRMMMCLSVRSDFGMMCLSVRSGFGMMCLSVRSGFGMMCLSVRSGFGMMCLSVRSGFGK